MCGPSWFLPIFLKPFYYNYFYKIKNFNDIENPNCPVCFIPIYESETEATKSSHKDNSVYMKTPCNHSFHQTCLKNWMELKLECPCCKQKLPPYSD